MFCPEHSGSFWKTSWRLLMTVASLTVAASAFAQSSTAPTKQEIGLSVTYTSLESAKASDVVAAPNVWLYVPSGKSPTPFLPGGKFSSVWNGSINVEKRANYLFQAELNGAL